MTTDQRTGGSSTANVTVRDGALVVTGELAVGLPFPWAGVIWMPGAQLMQAVDFSGREAIRFRTRRWAAVLGEADRERSRPGHRPP